MPRYEYKVVPAPAKGRKARGVKTPEARFALSVEDVLNEMGADGWDYLRAELLPSDERSGLTGTAVHWRNVLVFRRARDSEAEPFRPRLLDAAAATPAPVAEVADGTDVAEQPDLAHLAELSETAETAGAPAEPEPPAPLSEPPADPPIGDGARQMLKDDGVEELSEVSGMSAALRVRAALQTSARPAADKGDDDSDT